MISVHKQLSIFLANVPGTLASALKLLAQEKINILGMMVNDSIDHAVIRMVVDDPEKAVHLLGNEGLLVIESDVLGITIEDKPGSLLEVARALARAKINIAYTYATNGTGGQVMAFIKPADLSKAKKILKEKFKKAKKGSGRSCKAKT